MIFVWTKGHNCLSRLICAVTKERCSHFAIVFDIAAKGVMFHSNLLGTHPVFYETAKKKMDIIFEKKVNIPLDLENMIWDRIVEKYDGKNYDFFGALYLAIRILLNRWFKIKFPERNSWANNDNYYCNEIYDVFNEFYGFKQIPVTTGLYTPEKLLLQLYDWEWKE